MVYIFIYINIYRCGSCYAIWQFYVLSTLLQGDYGRSIMGLGFGLVRRA